MIIVSDFKFRKVVRLYFAVTISFLFSGNLSFGITTESVASELAYHLYKSGKADYAYIGASSLKEKEKYFNENQENVMKGHLYESFKANQKPFGVTAQNDSLNESMKFFSDIAIIAAYEKNKNINSSVFKKARNEAFSHLFKNTISPSATIDFVLKKLKESIMARKSSPNIGAFVNAYNIMLCAVYGSTDGNVGTGLGLISMGKDDLETYRKDLKWYMENWDMVEAMKIADRQAVKAEENMSFWERIKSKIEEKINSFREKTIGTSANNKFFPKNIKKLEKLPKQNYIPKRGSEIGQDFLWGDLRKEAYLMSEALGKVLNQVGKYTKENNTFRIDELAVDRLGALVNTLGGRCKIEVSDGYLNATSVFSHQMYEFNSYDESAVFSGIFQRLFNYKSPFLKDCDMTKLVTFRSVSNSGTPKELSISVEQLIQLLNFYCLIGELFDAQSKDSAVVHGLIKGSTIADFGSEYGGVNRVKKALQRWTLAKEM